MKGSSGGVPSGIPTFLSWALRQPSPKKEAYLQVFTGTPEAECARNLGLSRVELSAILAEVADARLSFAEDVYLVSLAMARDKGEFCRMTGQSEGVYKLVCMRRDAVRTLEHSPHLPKETADPSSSGGDYERDVRKELRKKARDSAKNARVDYMRDATSSLRHTRSKRAVAKPSDEGVPRNHGFSSEKVRPTIDRPSPSRDAILKDVLKEVGASFLKDTPISLSDFSREVLSSCRRNGLPPSQCPNDDEVRLLLDRSGRAVWASEGSFWLFDWKANSGRIRNMTERRLVVGKEYSVCLFFADGDSAARKLGIASPVQLYEVLRKVYSREKDAAFGPDLSVGFGRIDRRRQVREFVGGNVGLPLSELAVLYEKTYGFGASLVSKWIEEYAPDIMGRYSGAKPDLTVPLNRSSRSVGHRDAGLFTDEEQAFLDAELSRECCDAALVRGRFEHHFPGRSSLLQGDALLELNRYEDRGLLFSLEVPDPAEYFEALLASTPFFAKGDEGFEEAAVGHPAFERVLRKRLMRHQTLVYEKGCYMTFKRFQEVTGCDFLAVSEYGTQARSCVCEREPFTVYSLRTRKGFGHKLHALEMPDAFYESLIDLSVLTKSCVLGGKRIFVTGFRGRYRAADFMETFVSRNIGADRFELLSRLREEYGIECTESVLIATLWNSGVYHDDVNDVYYPSMESWKQGVRNELAR